MDNIEELIKSGAVKLVDTENKEIVLSLEPDMGDRSFKNIEMEQMINSLEPLLDHTDIIGYAAARNTRILTNEIQEYIARREELVAKYGEEVLDDDGNPTGQIQLRFDSPKFKDYSDEIIEWAEIEHEPPIYKIPTEKCIGILSGRQMLEIGWMLED